ncbi:hypothetical protein V2J09_009785 [Rumex salicifolius]
MGHAAIWTPYHRLSRTEFHLQCDTNTPTATWAKTLACGAHPITLPISAVRSRNPSGKTS